jgi:hypothetical protein
VWTGFNYSGKGPVVGFCEYSYDPLSLGKFPDQLSDHQLLKKDSVPWNCVIFITMGGMLHIYIDLILLLLSIIKKL